VKKTPVPTAKFEIAVLMTGAGTGRARQPLEGFAKT
jgi:hypothetical protein